MSIGHFMFQRSIRDKTPWRKPSRFAELRRQAKTVLILTLALSSLIVEAQNSVSHEKGFARTESRLLTNAVQFMGLSDKDYLSGCAFHLEGVVTLVDTNRNLLVLQDSTGAVAVNYSIMDSPVQVGQSVSLEGSECYPYIPRFPAYPYRSSGWDIRRSLEAPSDWGEFHLTRMRGFVHPPVTGEYTFWIASDNSSELRLSTNEDPSNARKIAFIARFSWVAPHEWSRYPSQRSEPILLKAGEAYYIEALKEQTTAADHLSVAWEGPKLKQAIIGGSYLTPWKRSGNSISPVETNGILREYWTNYSAGDLGTLTASSGFKSAFSVEKVQVNIHGRGRLPQARSIVLNQALTEDNNYRWVEVEGLVKFVGTDGNVAYLELSDGQGQIQVRALHWDAALLRRIHGSPVRVEGVCEAAYDQKATLVPGVLWASTENSISLAEAGRTNQSQIATEQPRRSPAADPAMTGFYATRGVVTFSDRVFDKDFMFVQEDTAVVRILLEERPFFFKKKFKTGQWVELAGALQPNKYLPGIRPLVMAEVGWGSMPVPVTEPVQFPVPGNRDGRWTEIRGVARSVNSDGTLSVMAKGGSLFLWIGQTPSNDLSHYVDAKLRARGVLSSAAAEAPLLLIPSRNFVDVEEEAPVDMSGIPARSVADLFSGVIEPSEAHRVRLVGAVTYRIGRSFFVEDQSGGVRVRAIEDPSINVGDTVEVIGFPTGGEPAPTVAEAVVRSAAIHRSIEPKELDLDRTSSFTQLGRLIRVNANLLSQRTAGPYQILELQERQRVFEATLPTVAGSVPLIEPGSRLKIVGVCDYETVALPAAGRNGVKKSSTTGPLHIRLRRPSDIGVLRGPPWWTLKRTVALVASLLTVSATALLWVHLLRRRLERQQAARLAFSRQILQGQETERQRIAVNLHDSLGQNLLVIKNQVRLAMQPATDDSALRKRLNEVYDVTSQAIEEVRQITHGLRPYQLDRLGLSQTIRAVVGRASENSTILFASYVDDIDGVFDKESEIHAYRIVQEAVNNVIKHSEATEATVVVKKQEASVSLSIRDNGHGFDTAIMNPSQPQHDLRYGLTGIAERARILRGTIVVDSRPGQGTNLNIEIPISVSRE